MRCRPVTLATSCFAFFFVLSSVALAERPALAVLDVDSAQPDVPPAVLATITDTMRVAAKSAIGGGVRVMTKQVMAQLATPEQLQCSAGKCIATIARILQARFVVGGELALQKGRWSLQLKSFDSSDGSLLGTLSLTSADPESLIDQVRTELARALPTWLQGLLTEDAGAAGTAALESEPTGAIVFIDGQVKCQATPCSVTVGPGQHEVRMELPLYKPQTRSVDLSKLGGKLRMALEENFGRVTIVTEPRGLATSVDGGRPQVAGGEQRLDASGHEIVIADDCFERSGLRFSLKAGEKRSIALDAQPVYGAARFRLVDANEDQLQAKVVVDGAELCQTPCTARVPRCAKSATLTDVASGRRATVPLSTTADATVDAIGRLSP